MATIYRQDYMTVKELRDYLDTIDDPDMLVLVAADDEGNSFSFVSHGEIGGFLKDEVVILVPDGMKLFPTNIGGDVERSAED